MLELERRGCLILGAERKEEGGLAFCVWINYLTFLRKKIDKVVSILKAQRVQFLGLQKCGECTLRRFTK
jgi:hypothetical protein